MRIQSYSKVASGIFSVLLSSWVAAADSNAARTGDWPTLGGSDQSQQYSALNQINAGNVRTLGLLWYSNLPVGEGLVGNPLVKDGVVYQSAPAGRAVATNLMTGATVWAFTPPLDMSSYSQGSMMIANVNRGIALDDNNVYVAGGCELYAVDRKTGKEVWHSAACDGAHDMGIAAAPIASSGKVFVGATNMQSGTNRSFAAAHDAKTGKELWRFYTVPGDPKLPYENKQMQAASKTWGDHYWTDSRGAGGVWAGMVYDPKTNLFIFGSGNPGVDGHEAEFADKAMLYSDSLIAVNATTGEYAWHLQETTGDVFHPGDATAHMMIADLAIEGAPRHVVMQAAKNGYFFIVDAKTGEFISAKNYVPTDNYNPIDIKTGTLSFREEVKYWKYPDKKVVLQPGGWGAHSWELTSYNVNTGLVYIPAFIFPYGNFAPQNGMKEHEEYGFQPGAKYKTEGRLIAWDPVTQTERWHVQRSVPINGGVLSTAGNLVFQGTPGEFGAFDAGNGRPLWTYKTGSVILAGPSTVSFQGKQIVLVPSGDGTATSAGSDKRLVSTPENMAAPSRLLAFALGGTATLPPTIPKKTFKPARARQPVELAHEGETLFAKNGCASCHGDHLVNSGNGRVPDLRNIREEKLQTMPQILQQGIFTPLGMPRFPHITNAQITALQAFITNEAWASYEGTGK